MIKVYGTPTCSQCKALSFELVKVGVTFDYKELNMSQLADIAKKYNTMKLPIVVKDGELIVGDNREIMKLIKGEIKWN
ncbi:MAG: hypothetical protein GY928_22240 [Colwellia sp.]|nr:hypothetical protein [Colwellia sp.]